MPPWNQRHQTFSTSKGKNNTMGANTKKKLIKIILGPNIDIRITMKMEKENFCMAMEVLNFINIKLTHLWKESINVFSHT